MGWDNEENLAFRSRKKNRKRTSRKKLKGGRKRPKIRTRSSFKLHRRHLKALKRDKFQCRICEQKGKMEVHHLVPWAWYEEVRADLANLATVCPKCHLQKCHAGDYSRVDKSIALSLFLENIKKKAILKHRITYLRFFSDTIGGEILRKKWPSQARRLDNGAKK